MLESVDSKEYSMCIPDQDEASPGLKEQCAGQYDPVHQPWLQQRGIGGLESFVGGEHREEKRRDRSAPFVSTSRSYSQSLGGKTHGGVNQSYDKSLAKVSNIVAIGADP